MTEHRCGYCGGMLEGRQEKWCSENCRKRGWEHSDQGRGVCIDCGQPKGTAGFKQERCRPCYLNYEVGTSLTAQILQRFNAGATHLTIAAELGISVPHVGQMIHRIRHTEWGSPYIERYGFPAYRRTPAQRERIQTGARRGMGLAA